MSDIMIGKKYIQNKTGIQYKVIDMIKPIIPRRHVIVILSNDNNKIYIEEALFSGRT